jgi:uncharacterized protein YciI
MLFIARFIDKPGIAEKRAKLLDAHFAWLNDNRDKVLIAGALKESLEEPGQGSVWIIEADNKAEVERVYQAEPFFANGLREKVEIYHYIKANADRPVTI